MLGLYVCDNRDGWLVAWGLCFTEKAAPTRHRPERQHNARANRRKQCSPNETKPYSKPTLPRKLLLPTVTPHAAGSILVFSRTQECARTHPVTRRATTQYLQPRTSQPAEVADATTIRTPPASCQLTGPMALIHVAQRKLSKSSTAKDKKTTTDNNKTKHAQPKLNPNDRLPVSLTD